MTTCNHPWNTGSEFLRRMVDLGFAQFDGSFRRTVRYNELCLEQLIAQLPMALAPSIDHANQLRSVSLHTQDELLEDGCNLLQIAFMVEAELMYWSDCLAQSWLESAKPCDPTEH